MRIDFTDIDSLYSRQRWIFSPSKRRLQTMSIIVVTGSRKGKLSSIQTAKFCRLLLDLCDSGDRNFLRHGDCTGIDTEASKIAKAFFGNSACQGIRLYVDPFPVDHKLDGPWPSAGPSRNTRMLLGQKESAKTHRSNEVAEELIAFPGGTGTASCIRIARSLGVAIWHWSERYQDFTRDVL